MGFLEKVKDALAGAAVCKTCERKVTFKIRVEDQRLMDGRESSGLQGVSKTISKAVYCRTHGCEMIGFLIREFKQPSVFTEMGDRYCSAEIGTFLKVPG